MPPHWRRYLTAHDKVYQARSKLRDLRQYGRPAIQYFRELDGLRADIPSLTNGELCFVAVQGLDADVELQVTLQLGLGSNDYHGKHGYVTC